MESNDENEAPANPVLPIGWMAHLSERERKEVWFAFTYAEHYNHGTDGHSRLLLIAKLANLLNAKGE